MVPIKNNKDQKNLFVAYLNSTGFQNQSGFFSTFITIVTRVKRTVVLKEFRLTHCCQFIEQITIT